MGYVESVLQPGERVIHQGRLHWIIYAPAAVLLLAAAVCAWIGLALADLRIVFMAVAGLLLLAAIVAAAKAWFDRWITEIAVTDRRVIYKRGFIRRYTAEMNMEKVESVTVNQSVLGRVFDYGTIHIRGVGVGIEHLHGVASPIEVRNTIVAR